VWGGVVTAPVALEQRLIAFRRGFDQAFATAPITSVETFEDLLAVRVAGDAYALRVREITGLVASGKIVPLPSKRSELLGIAGNRGSLVAVYSLAALLGYRADSKPTPWLALAGGSEPIGLGFEAFEGFLRVRSGDMHEARPTEGARPHVGEVVLAGNQSLRVVDIASTIATLEVRSGTARSPKES
jgi:chemotaxis signal transduction protein